MKHKGVLAFIGVGLWSCSASPPPYASVAEHEAHAEHAEHEASEHGAQFDENAARTRFACRHGAASREAEGACWSWEENPTLSHLHHAEELRQAAQAHREAAAVLVDAEAKACQGLTDLDRDMSPFDQRDDILEAKAEAGAATVTFRRVAGLSREGLERLIACHVARNAAMGFAMQEMAFCPLALKGISAKVEETPAGLTVRLSAPSDGAVELAQRVKALKP